MTNPTERPGERDSLAEIEKRLRSYAMRGYLTGDPRVQGLFRTLINEVKELGRELDEERHTVGRYHRDILRLEAEVKELREAAKAVLWHVDGIKTPDPRKVPEVERLRDLLSGGGPGR